MAFQLTPKQIEVRSMLASTFMHCLIYGGSRSGKTFLLCYAVAMRAMSAPNSRHLIARFRRNAVMNSIWQDTWPKMMRLVFPEVEIQQNKTEGLYRFPNGAEIWLDGLDDAERVEKILGNEYATIYMNECSQIPYDTVLTLRSRLAQNVLKSNGRPLALKMYYDLNPVGRAHWTYKEFVEQVRPENGLPIRPGTRAYATMNPDENPNLHSEYLDALNDLPERQRKRFLMGQYLTEVPGALWTLDTLEACRRDVVPVPLVRIAVGVDPSGSDGVGGDRQGIVTAGLGIDDRGYVIADNSVRLDPNGWGKQAVWAYNYFLADIMVAEGNYGGAMVESTIKTVDPNVNVKMVHASRGKHIRAEPVAALYEQGKVSHIGAFRELEDQMGLMTTTGYQQSDSPDRIDALVWALTELMLDSSQHKVVWA